MSEVQWIVGPALIGSGDVCLAEIGISEGRIVQVNPAANRKRTIPEDCTLLPGLIDLQVNGAVGADISSSPDSIWQVAEALPRHGVTAFLPTVITSEERISARAAACLRARPARFHGAEPLGLHLEGPLISQHRRGTHPLRHIQTNAARALDSFRRIKPLLVTLAPELDPSGEVVRELIDGGTAVAIGHSDASFEVCRAAFEEGAVMATHLYNAMSPLHHRQPGLVGAVLSSPYAKASIIADGIHVSEPVVVLTWQCLGSDRLILVTDAMAGLGVPDGIYRFGGKRVRVSGRTAWDQDGALAGGVCPLDLMLANLTRWTGADLSETAKTVTVNPAATLQLGDRGALAIGSRADITVVDAETRCVRTIIGGKMVFDRIG